MPLLSAVNRVSRWQTNSNTGTTSNSDLVNNVKLTTANNLRTRMGDLVLFLKISSLQESTGFKN